MPSAKKSKTKAPKQFVHYFEASAYRKFGATEYGAMQDRILAEQAGKKGGYAYAIINDAYDGFLATFGDKVPLTQSHLNELVGRTFALFKMYSPEQAVAMFPDPSRNSPEFDALLWRVFDAYAPP